MADTSHLQPRERPVLFSAPMVRALLAGTKTQTRRICKDESTIAAVESGCEPMFTRKAERLSGGGIGPRMVGMLCSVNHGPDLKACIAAFCPHGQPGDRLWVRESFKAITSGEIKDGYGEVRHGWAYQADGATRWNERPTIIHDLTGQPATGPMQFRPVPWKPSIHMPRRASRITLEITEVRVQRLNSISEEDALAEGIDMGSDFANLCINIQTAPYSNDLPRGSAEVAVFRQLWESINGAGSWDANPWVWCISFRRAQPEQGADHG